MASLMSGAAKLRSDPGRVVAIAADFDATAV
jgi:hypothetical protein